MNTKSKYYVSTWKQKSMNLVLIVIRIWHAKCLFAISLLCRTLVCNMSMPWYEVLNCALDFETLSPNGFIHVIWSLRETHIQSYRPRYSIYVIWLRYTSNLCNSSVMANDMILLWAPSLYHPQGYIVIILLLWFPILNHWVSHITLDNMLCYSVGSYKEYIPTLFEEKRSKISMTQSKAVGQGLLSLALLLCITVFLYLSWRLPRCFMYYQ